MNHNGVFWRWWTAGTASDVGTAVSAVALPLTALTVLEATPFEMGLITAAAYLAWLVVGLPAGVIVHRLPLRGAQVGADLVRAVAVGSIPVAWWWGYLTITHLVVTALVVGLADVLFDVANMTFLPSIVGRDQLQARNSLTSATHAVTQLSGPSLGGVAVALIGAVPTILVDAVSYLVSAALLRTLPPRRSVEHADGTARRQPARVLVREGWQFVVRHPVIRPTMWAAAVVSFACGAQMALYPLYLVRDVHAPTALVGALLAADGVGALLGAAITPRLSNWLGSARALVVADVVLAGGAALAPVGTGWPALVAFTLGSVGFAAGTIVLSVLTRTYRQIASPPTLLSRIMATVRFLTRGMVPVGGLVAGLVAGVMGARTTLLAVAVVTVGAPLVLLLSPVRHLRELTDHPATALGLPDAPAEPDSAAQANPEHEPAPR